MSGAARRTFVVSAYEPDAPALVEDLRMRRRARVERVVAVGEQIAEWLADGSDGLAGEDPRVQLSGGDGGLDPERVD